MATTSPTKKLMKSPAKAAPAAAAEAPAAEAAETTAPAAKKGPAVKAVSKSATKVTPSKEAVAVEAAETSDTAEEAGDMIVQTANEIENLKEAKAFDMVPRLIDDSDRNSFRLGGILSKIQSEGWFMNKGFENFKGYVEAECSIKYRKAMYLIGIYNGLVESGVPWAKVSHLGWTKLKELAGILTPDNVDEWVGVAETMTALQLIDYIAKATAGAETASSTEDAQKAAKETSTKTFKLHKDQRETVDEALKKAKHAGGTDHDSVALEMICIDYLGGTPKVANLKEIMESKSMEEVLQAMQEAFPTLVMQAAVYDTVEEAQAAQAEIDAAAEAEEEAAG
jgi:hypothetical protein